MSHLSPFANTLATIIAALLTGLFGYFTARLTAKVQQQATKGSESERAWKRADKGEEDADAWREKWAKEFELRVKTEARVQGLVDRITELQQDLAAATATPSGSPPAPST